MTRPDLNLLYTLEVLLAEGNVARAARRLKLSPSAMSRALARLREATGDPLLLRAGRGMVASPRALELRESISQLVQDAQAALRAVGQLDPAQLERTFTLRASEGFVENFGARLLARIATEAPGVRLHFLHKLDKDSGPLRDGSVDLETGVVARGTAPEFRQQSLFRDRYVGVVREGHPLAQRPVTLARYAEGRHVSVARRGIETEQVDGPLHAAGMARNIVTVVGGFGAALALARETDLVASVPARHTESLRRGMHTFALPFETPELSISLLWHPRMDADPAHRWLRDQIRQACASAVPARWR